MNSSKQNIEIDLDEEIVNYVKNLCDINFDFKEAINKIVTKALELNNILDYDVFVSISSATQDEIKKLNNEYRGVDKKTDVLSFPIFERYEIEEMAKSNNNLSQINLGDIILCMDVVKEHSIEYDTGMVRETLYMITHGICHLLGFDHIKEDEKVVMRDLEEKILNSLEVF